MYNYKAKIDRVVDGDTVDATIDLGFDVKIVQRLRLFGVDTPESRTRNKEEKKKGLEVKEYVKQKLDGKVVEVTTNEKGKFGRFLATIYVDGINLNKTLISTGRAQPYFGGKKKGWDEQ